MRHRCRIAFLAVSSLALAGVALTGCSSGNASRKAEFRSNPTPELLTLSETRDQVDNQLTITNDTNMRMISEDFGRFWLMDRPSRMNRRSIPY
jgi:hypothetical protein